MYVNPGAYIAGGQNQIDTQKGNTYLFTRIISRGINTAAFFNITGAWSSAVFEVHMYQLTPTFSSHILYTPTSPLTTVGVAYTAAQMQHTKQKCNHNLFSCCIYFLHWTSFLWIQSPYLKQQKVPHGPFLYLQLQPHNLYGNTMKQQPPIHSSL